MLSELPCGLILLYHRLGRPASDPWNLFLDPDLFKSQMSVLADHWPVLTVSQGLRRLQQRQPGHWVALAFDDAYEDAADLALERLRSGQSLTIFACTNEPDREFWWDRLSDPRLQKALRGLPNPQVEAGDTGRARRLQPRQLKQLSRDHEIASHTHRHLSLPNLPPHQQSQEMATARKLLQDWLGGPVEGLAYPFGDFNDEVAERAQQHSQWACGLGPGLVWSGTPRWRLPRSWIPPLQGRAFHQWLRAQGLS